MKISDIFNQKKRVLSFELFAPKKDEDVDNLFLTVEQLKTMRPDYISITYGAAGSSRDKTFNIAVRLKAAGVLPLMHFTCIDHSRSEIKSMLEKVKAAGIENLLALRGDRPQDKPDFVPPPDGFRYASELVKFIRSEGYDFCLGIAGYPEGHPEAKSKEEDLLSLKKKVDAGGQFIDTQLFFDNRFYFSYVEHLRAMGVRLPVQPGIWLLTDYAQIQKICGLIGATLPRTLRDRVEPVKDNKDEVARIGIEHAIEQCEELLDKGAPGIHFYVLNRSHHVQKVLEGLKAKGYLFG
jgi:methylenetetrahydrofolate reductase (NADPH)